MAQQFSHESIAILHELDLGQHTLFIMSDGRIDLLANDEQTSYLADNGLCLDRDEVYRLFISLQEQFEHSHFPGSGKPVVCIASAMGGASMPTATGHSTFCEKQFPIPPCDEGKQ